MATMSWGSEMGNAHGVFSIPITSIFFSLHHHGNSLTRRKQEVMLTCPGSLSHLLLFKDLSVSLVTWFVLSRCQISQILLLSGIGLLSLREWVGIIKCPSSILISKGSALNCGKGGMRSYRLFHEKPGWRQGRIGRYVRQFLWVKGGGPSINQEGRGVCRRSEGKPGLPWTGQWSLEPSASPPSNPQHSPFWCPFLWLFLILPMCFSVIRALLGPWYSLKSSHTLSSGLKIHVLKS